MNTTRVGEKRMPWKRFFFPLISPFTNSNKTNALYLNNLASRLIGYLLLFVFSNSLQGFLAPLSSRPAFGALVRLPSVGIEGKKENKKALFVMAIADWTSNNVAFIPQGDV